MFKQKLDTTLCDKVCQWLGAGRWFFPVFWYPLPIKPTAWYNWNIVESWVKHHYQPNPKTYA